MILNGRFLVKQSIAPATTRALAIWALIAVYVALIFAAPVFAQADGRLSRMQDAGLPLDTQGTAYLIVRIFDSSGTVVAYDKFSQTADPAFATDLNGVPYTRASSIWDASSAASVPVFIVPTQTRCQLHILWEVPDFGKIVLHADNAGDGYVVAQTGGRLTLNFNHEAAKSTLARLEKDYDLYRGQGYSLTSYVAEGIIESKKHLKAAEGYLALTPHADMKNATIELNASLNLSLRASEQLQLDRAKTDIEKYRKGGARLKIVDMEGKPLVNSTVSFKQTSRDFLFGANPMGKSSRYSQVYAQMLREAGINYSYILSSWGSVEPSPGNFAWVGQEYYQNISAQSAMGFRFMGGLSLWFYRGSGLSDQFCPHYQDMMTFEQLKENIYNHMYALASRYKGRIDIWEINEQNTNGTNVLNLTWNQKLEAYSVFAKAVHDANPKAQVIHDSNALPYEFNPGRLGDLGGKAGAISFPEFLTLLNQKQSPLDIIGLELYYSGVNSDGYKNPGLDMASISALLDQYASFGKPIFVRELSAPSVQVPDSSWWHRPWDEPTQAEYLEQFYTIAFSKPLVHEIGWSYGVSDENAFLVGGGLLDTDLKPKAAYFALKKLIDSWTTSGMATTDEKGQSAFKGFAGDYEVKVTTPDGRSGQRTVHINEQKSDEFTIVPVLPLPHPSQTTVPSAQAPSPKPTSSPTPAPITSPTPSSPPAKQPDLTPTSTPSPVPSSVPGRGGMGCSRAESAPEGSLSSNMGEAVPFAILFVGLLALRLRNRD